MVGPPLSEQTLQHLRALFASGVQRDAEAFLVEECGANLPWCEESSPEDMERIRFAALKLSGGTLNGLCDAIQLGQKDWRDLLAAAEFADNVNAHKQWIP